jgi:hypothetical protein
MTDHDLDDLKARLHRCFGVQVHRDLQVRAEIIIQPEAGRWLFTPAELGELLDGLNAILLNSNRTRDGPSVSRARNTSGCSRRSIMAFSSRTT